MIADVLVTTASETLHRIYEGPTYRAEGTWSHNIDPLSLALDIKKTEAYVESFAGQLGRSGSSFECLILAFSPDSFWHLVFCHSTLWLRRYRHVFVADAARLESPRYWQKIEWARNLRDRDMRFVIALGFDAKWEGMPFYEHGFRLLEEYVAENDQGILIREPDEQALAGYFADTSFENYMTFFHNRPETENILCPYISYRSENSTSFDFSQYLPDRSAQPFICENFGCSTFFLESKANKPDKFRPFGLDTITIQKVIHERGGVAGGSAGLVPATFAFYHLLLSYLTRYGRGNTPERRERFLYKLSERELITAGDRDRLVRNWHELGSWK